MRIRCRDASAVFARAANQQLWNFASSDRSSFSDRESTLPRLRANHHATRRISPGIATAASGRQGSVRKIGSRVGVILPGFWSLMEVWPIRSIDRAYFAAPAGNEPRGYFCCTFFDRCDFALGLQAVQLPWSKVGVTSGGQRMPGTEITQWGNLANDAIASARRVQPPPPELARHQREWAVPMAADEARLPTRLNTPASRSDVFASWLKKRPELRSTIFSQNANGKSQDNPDAPTSSRLHSVYLGQIEVVRRFQRCKASRVVSSAHRACERRSWY